MKNTDKKQVNSPIVHDPIVNDCIVNETDTDSVEANKPRISTTDITVITERNQPLTATIYAPFVPQQITSNDSNNVQFNDKKNADKAQAVSHAVMIAPATGIKRQFYNSFANYLAGIGFGVITYDNEGIGDSLTCPLHKCDASLISWGRHDMTAILDVLQQEFVNASYHLVGHSAGGQLIGLMPNHDLLSSVVNIACSSGQIANMDMPFRAQAKIFMNLAIPLGNAVLGYTPSDKFGMGEPLPKGVAKQWHDWCNGAGYIKTAFGKTVHTHFYDDIITPALWLNFTDDDIANRKNVADMTRVFTKMPIETQMIDPQDFDLKNIGHMKYFSRKTYIKAPKLWQITSDWIKRHSIVQDV